MSRIFRGPSAKLLVFILIFNACSYNFWKNWGGHDNPMYSDADQYYSYLVAAFIKHDLSFNFEHGYWLMPAPNGKSAPKVSIGLAYLYAPSFFIAHVVATLTGAPTDRYSPPYGYGIYYGGILFVVWGLYMLRRVLLMYFTEAITTVTIASVYFGTNLFFYTLGWSLMPHGYLFTLFTLILYLTIKWHNGNQMKYMLWMGLIAGLAVLIRPTEIVLLLIPMLYGVRTFADLQKKLVLFWAYRVQILLAACMAVLPWIPQWAYWKIYTGNFFFYTYGEEGFYFFNPQFFNVLLSYRKGWLVYTPIMIFALLGFLFLRKRCPDHFWGIVLQFGITYYLVSSWWCWWWGGCFGLRALVQSYAFLALPMACFYQWAFSAQTWRKISIGVLVALMIAYNLYQTNRYKTNVIHWDSMSKKAFWYSIFKIHMSKEEGDKYELMLEHPDYSKKGDK